jgi:putative membrane protein
MTIEANQPAKTANELAEERTDLAVHRTVMAADRSLMAWVRTGLSMISFGFTVYKLLQAAQANGAVLPRAGTPRTIGLFLTGLGTLALIAGTVEYLQAMKDMNQHYARRIVRPALVMALLLAAVGSFMFVGIIVRLA